MEQKPATTTFPSPRNEDEDHQFMKQNFGDRVSVAAFPAPGAG